MKKQVKLLVHQKTFSEDELILNPKEFAMVNVGDVVEIYHVEDEYSRLLLQVTSMNEDKQQSIKDSISIDQSIATTFNLRTYKDVIVNQVPPEHVTLDLVELTFKDQYISRSDMWRLKNSLVDSCVYITRKVEFSGIRAQISELWAKSEKVACGVISEVTKVVFRSSTAMVYLFLQMSSEMWEFDVYGDLYLEKAIEFLTELFTQWKEKNNFHELTIVLFSRTFYEAQSIEDFPVSIRACLLQDYRGQIYEDFYRIIALNERRDDWRPLLVTLKKVFNQYPKQIIRKEVNGEECPPGYNSTSVVGNFLEAINLSLNVFDKHYVNRNFDRTGQLAIVITPGAGVFEVDRDLCNITKQRMIDNGIGSDLVCMAEQPLHAAPLFKFHNKQGHTDIGDDYNIPYWINHSFYTSKHQQQRAPNSFIPRIKLAETVELKPLVALDPPLYQPSDLVLENGRKVLTDIDYDAYDAQVFKIPSHVKHGLPNHYLAPTRFERYTDRVTKRRQAWGRMASVELKPVTSDVEVPSKSYSSDAVQIPRSRTRAITISGCSRRSSHERKMLSKSFHESGSVEENDSLPKRTIVGSASMVTDHPFSKAWPYAQRQRRALINPFAPSQMFDRLTSNKRRWTHTFPIGPSGKAMQTHHQLTLLDNIDDEPYGCSPPTRKVTAAASAAVEFRKKVSVHARTTDSDSQNSFGFHSSASMSSMSSNVSLQSLGAESVKTVQSIGSVINTHELTTEYAYRGRSETLTSHRPAAHSGPNSSLPKNMKEGWYWGVTGEQEWSPLMQTGVDWKSLIWPACLPLTTDFYPKDSELNKSYKESMYTLLADEILVGTKKLSVEQVYKEIISQRLMQGCQLIVMSRKTPKPKSATSMSGRNYQEASFEYFLSMGRTFHRFSLSEEVISVYKYRPRHLYSNPTVEYRYQLWTVDKKDYEPATALFRPSKLGDQREQITDEFNWNYLDNYVCACEDYGLMESLKYWRSRFLLLPACNAATKKITDGSSETFDIYTTEESNPSIEKFEGFLRFIEGLNRIRRPPGSMRKQMKQAHDVQQPTSRPPSRRPSTAELTSLTSQTVLEKEGSPAAAQKSTPINVIATTSTDVATDNAQTSMLRDAMGTILDKTDGEDASKDEDERLTLKSPLVDIVKAMKDPSIGMTFLPTDQRLLPKNSFMSAEAVYWLVQTIPNTTEQQAVEIFQKMTEDELICHASCIPSHSFVNGFYLYFITPEKDDSSQHWRYSKKYSNFNTFQNDWFEVALHMNQHQARGSVPVFLQPSLPRRESIPMSPPPHTRGGRPHVDAERKGTQVPNYKNLILDVDINNKSDRVEWSHIRYHGKYQIDGAFEIEVQWLVSTPCLIMDMLQGWARKAGVCGFHLVSVPIDPFGLYSQYSDPLRSPLFIDLDIRCCLVGESRLFATFDPETYHERIQLLQDEILRRFGFLHDPWSGSSHPVAMDDTYVKQYVHTTGTAFALIPETDRPETSVESKLHSATMQDSPLKHTPTVRTLTAHKHGRIGFYWTQNFLLTKRWRSASTGDEKFGERLLKDFTSFCANEDNRLLRFWESCQQELQGFESSK